jgi:hypothetical protein
MLKVDNYIESMDVFETRVLTSRISGVLGAVLSKEPADNEIMISLFSLFEKSDWLFSEGVNDKAIQLPLSDLIETLSNLKEMYAKDLETR